MPEIPSSGPPTPEGGADRKNQLKSLQLELGRTHDEWKLVSAQIHQMLHSQEPERGRAEFGEQGGQTLLASADLAINKITNLEAEILSLFEE